MRTVEVTEQPPGAGSRGAALGPGGTRRYPAGVAGRWRRRTGAGPAGQLGEVAEDCDLGVELGGPGGGGRVDHIILEPEPVEQLLLPLLDQAARRNDQATGEIPRSSSSFTYRPAMVVLPAPGSSASRTRNGVLGSSSP
jgi:hypothetical protein